ncbi:MAG: hypothetical protein ACOC58_02565, partial [Chloroflexota bacterium]
LRRICSSLPRTASVLLLLFTSTALFTMGAIAFVQVPLQSLLSQAMQRFLGYETMLQWVLLTGIPAVLLSGLVQEGAKLLPVLVFFKLNQPPDARAGLTIGAIAGAGFGIFEAQWALNLVFASGWTWGWVQSFGFQALLGFWKRFFAVAFHIAATAIAAYGLWRGKWWQFYLLASLLHALTNYGELLLRAGSLTAFQTEMYGAGLALMTMAVALWLRWRPAGPSETGSGSGMERGGSTPLQA